jgi:2-polyprenyl-3-methyl-5-hydroxy-6-metoxy-1,4-benzoquinol methylase
MSEPQYAPVREFEPETLGLMTGHAWSIDPKRLVFTLSRYKFVAKMLIGRQCVLEIGCGDAFGTRIVQQEVNHLVAVDFDPVFVADVHARQSKNWPFTCFQHDMTGDRLQPPKRFDGIYALDVLEHISREFEHRFLSNLVASLDDHGIAIIGSPSLESQRIASPISAAGHCNCKSGPDLRETLLRYFYTVFLFSMNDEVVHTGNTEMAHYLMALCVQPRSLKMANDHALRSSP